MATKLKKYLNLFSNIKNWQEYIFHKAEYRIRPLNFITKPNKITFSVKGDEYPVFKELFMADFYKINELVNTLPDNPIIVDIGANIGLFPVLLLSKINSATVLAYEPLPTNFDRLLKTIQKNDRLAKSVKAFQEAVTGENQNYIDIHFEHSKEGTAFASTFENFDKRNTSKIKVPCTTLEKILLSNNIQKIDFLKLDCEGCEFSILYNLNSNLFNSIYQMFIEVHELDNNNKNIKHLSDFLITKGYNIKIQKVGKDSLLWARRKE